MMENLKHTKEYAELEAKKAYHGTIHTGNEINAFTYGYLHSIEETAAPELLEALNTLIEHLESKDAREENQYIKETFFKRMPEFLGYIKAGKNAINKATK